MDFTEMTFKCKNFADDDKNKFSFMKITSFDLRTKPKEEIYRKRTIRDLFCSLRHHKNINCFSFFAKKTFAVTK
jgi:hypothetical protein